MIQWLTDSASTPLAETLDFVENIYSDCPTPPTYERMTAIYTTLLYSSSIFHPRNPRMPLCHLREPSISTLPLEVSNYDSPDLPSILTLIIPSFCTCHMHPEFLTSSVPHLSHTSRVFNISVPALVTDLSSF
jgi:hypothetical protein